MATIFESITIPRSYAIPSSTISPISNSVRNSVKFHDFRGLKMRPCSVTRSSGPIIGRRSGGIVCEAQGTAVSVPNLTDGTWQSLVLDCEVTLMVEFWAPWCGPCRMMHPVIDELAKEYAGKLKCYKVNTDECPTIATKYGIRSIPTVIIFKNGEKKDSVIGAVPKSTLVTSIEKIL